VEDLDTLGLIAFIQAINEDHYEKGVLYVPVSNNSR
ncbi:unnamed protein product, partial [Rotaria sp. Silwood1]